jgi:hypothetical protein
VFPAYDARIRHPRYHGQFAQGPIWLLRSVFQDGDE